MAVIPANIGSASWGATQNHAAGSFRPNGKLFLVPHGPRYTPNPDPRTWREPGGQTLAARLFVGFNVQGQPRWNVDDLIRVVRKVRVAQGKPLDSSFLAQTGIYTSQLSGEVEVEKGAQVVLINLTGDSVESFTDQIVELAEAIAQALDQELVIAEIQQGGRVLETIGAAGPILHQDAADA